MFVFLEFSPLYPNNRLRRLQVLLPLKSVLLKSGMVQLAIVFPPTGPVQLMTKHPISILKFMQSPPIHIHLPTPLYRVPPAYFKWSGHYSIISTSSSFDQFACTVVSLEVRDWYIYIYIYCILYIYARWVPGCVPGTCPSGDVV